jgi:hypothetical protein
MYFVHKHIKIHHLLTNIISHINIPCIHICYHLLLFVITSPFHIFAGDIFVFADESCYRWCSMFLLAFHLFAGVLSLSLAYVYFAGAFSFHWRLACGNFSISLAILLFRWRHFCIAGVFSFTLTICTMSLVIGVLR